MKNTQPNLVTAAAKASPVEVRAAIVAVQAFNVFTKDNDPFGEHHCASFTLNEQCFF